MKINDKRIVTRNRKMKCVRDIPVGQVFEASLTDFDGPKLLLRIIDAVLELDRMTTLALNTVVIGYCPLVAELTVDRLESDNA